MGEVWSWKFGNKFMFNLRHANNRCGHLVVESARPRKVIQVHVNVFQMLLREQPSQTGADSITSATTDCRPFQSVFIWILLADDCTKLQATP